MQWISHTYDFIRLIQLQLNTFKRCFPLFTFDDLDLVVQFSFQVRQQGLEVLIVVLEQCSGYGDRIKQRRRTEVSGWDRMVGWGGVRGSGED